MLKKIGLASLFLALTCHWSASTSQTLTASRTYSAAQLNEDLLFLKQAIGKTHPNLAHSVDTQRLDRAFKDVERQLQKPMTSEEAWRVVSTLNPVFADGHLLVALPDIEKQAAAHVQSGLGFFPFEVQVEANGDVYILAELGGASSALASRRIETINGIPAREIAALLLARTHGDTPELRANILSTRWWRFYWKTFGAPSHFDLTIAKAGAYDTIGRAAVSKLPASLASAADFEQQFKFELLPENTALLTINTFWWPDKKLFYAFTKQAFASIRDKNVTTLLIDIRRNTGGDDDMWKEGVLRYIADKPYRHGSTYQKMVLEGRQSASEKAGQVINGTIQSWEQPDSDNPFHFSGKTYVLVGRTSYSSAILFSNTVQDFKFGTIVGARGYARARQSGGIQLFSLPHTKLSVVVPRFILDRPAGAGGPELIQPDIVVADDPFNSRSLIDALHAQIFDRTQ
ncbi:MAG TPA: S41 family peptidase [Telluria sp.]